jgi:hypothetical protein
VNKLCRILCTKQDAHDLGSPLLMLINKESLCFLFLWQQQQQQQQQLCICQLY